MMMNVAKQFFKALRVPVIQAPMAGGINNPAMASAAANAGGVGSFGFAYSTPEKIEADLLATRALTSGALNANFFIFQPIQAPTDKDYEDAVLALQALPFSNQVSFSKPKEPFFPDLNKQLEPIWKQRPELLTFHFGIPSNSVLEKAKSLGIMVGISATSSEEALQISEAGADFIVAQGIEAGGHRGIFNPLADDKRLTAKSLLKELKGVVDLPIVSAGGIMTPKDVKEFMNLGADAAQMGTAFLTTQESTASAAHKSYLLNPNGPQATFTWGFSGRPAQGIENEFMLKMAQKPILAFPLQNTLTGPLRQKAAQENEGQYQSLWCGTEYKKCRSISVAEFMSEIQRELG